MLVDVLASIARAQGIESMSLGSEGQGHFGWEKPSPYGPCVACFLPFRAGCQSKQHARVRMGTSFEINSSQKVRNEHDMSATLDLAPKEYEPN